MFATKLYYTAGHAGIQVFGDIDLCIPIWNTSRVNELGTYQAKHGMMPQTRYAFSTEPNRTMKVGVSVSTVRFHPTIKIVGFPAHVDKLSSLHLHNFIILQCLHNICMGMWCNLDSTTACGAVGYGFKSRHARFCSSAIHALRLFLEALYTLANFFWYCRLYLLERL